MKKNLTKALRTLALLLMLLFIIISPSFAEDTVTFSTSGIDYGWFEGWFPYSDRIVAIVNEKFPNYGTLQYSRDIGEDRVDISQIGNYGAIYHGVYYNMWDTEFDRDQNSGGFYIVTALRPNNMGLAMNLFSVNTNGDDYYVWNDRSRSCSTTYNIHLDEPTTYYMYAYSGFDYEFHVNVDGVSAEQAHRLFPEDEIYEYFDLEKYDYDPNKTTYTITEFDNFINHILDYYEEQNVRVNKDSFLEKLFWLDDSVVSLYGNVLGEDVGCFLEFEVDTAEDTIKLFAKQIDDSIPFIDNVQVAIGEAVLHEAKKFVLEGIVSSIYHDEELLSRIDYSHELQSGREIYGLEFEVPAGDHEIVIKHEIKHITMQPNSFKNAFVYEIATKYEQLSDFSGLPFIINHDGKEPELFIPKGETDPFHLRDSNDGKQTKVRPTWRQSEEDAHSQYPDFQKQVSFKDHNEEKYGTKGSVRPDLFRIGCSFCDDGCSIEVKNYNIEKVTGRIRLIRIIKKQYEQRKLHLPIGSKQLFWIDVRGQNVSEEDLVSLQEAIIKQTDTDILIQFKTDKEE